MTSPRRTFRCHVLALDRPASAARRRLGYQRMSPSGIALCTASRPSPQNISPRALISPHAHGSRRFGWPAHRDPCSERCWNVPLGRIERRIPRRGQRKTPDSEALSSVTEILILFLFFWCRDATWPAIEARKMLSAEATEARGVPAEHGRFHRFATYAGVFRRRHPEAPGFRVVVCVVDIRALPSVRRVLHVRGVDSARLPTRRASRLIAGVRRCVWTLEMTGQAHGSTFVFVWTIMLSKPHEPGR